MSKNENGFGFGQEPFIYKYKYNDGGLDECTQHTPVIVYNCLNAKLMKIENNANTQTHISAIKVFGEAFLAALKQNEMFRLNLVFVNELTFFSSGHYDEHI